MDPQQAALAAQFSAPRYSFGVCDKCEISDTLEKCLFLLPDDVFVVFNFCQSCCDKPGIAQEVFNEYTLRLSENRLPHLIS